MCCASYRRIRAQDEWKVMIHMSSAMDDPTRRLMRSRISLGGLVRERDGEDLTRTDARTQQVCDAVGDDARLARPGPGDDENGPLRRQDGLALDGVEPCQEVGRLVRLGRSQRGLGHLRSMSALPTGVALYGGSQIRCAPIARRSLRRSTRR